MVTKSTQITFSLPIEFAEEIRWHCTKSDVPISSLIRRSIRRMLDDFPDVIEPSNTERGETDEV